jgi:DNA replication protein DnaC
MTAGAMVGVRGNLVALQLTTMSKNLEGELRRAAENHIGYDEFLLSLTDLELQVRRENGFRRRLREARFPLLKTLDAFDFSATSDLNPRVIQELAEGEYLRQARNIILVGRSGTGKTHLATALGIESCREGIRTRFLTVCGLVNELLEARAEQSLKRALRRYQGYGLLILDELGYVPLSRDGANLLFQVLAERHERRSVIITTNLAFGDWTQVFEDPNLTAALLDRVTHRAHIIECHWDSYRLKETLRRKGEKRKVVT